MSTADSSKETSARSVKVKRRRKTRSATSTDTGTSDIEVSQDSGQTSKKANSHKQTGDSTIPILSEPQEVERRHATSSGPVGSSSSSDLTTQVFQISDKHRSLFEEALVEWMSQKAGDRGSRQAFGIAKYKAYAMQMLLKSMEHNLRVSQEKDKRERLDSGKPTEIPGTKDSLDARIGSLLDKIDVAGVKFKPGGDEETVESVEGSGAGS